MKRILAYMLTVMILAAALIIPATVSADDANAYYEEHQVTAYLYDAKTKKNFTCMFREDMNLPYISAEDYLDQVYTAKFKTTENDDGTFTVSNKNGGFKVDPEKDTVHFDAYEKVAFFDAKPISEDMKADYINDDHFNVGSEKLNGLDLNPGKYNIDIIDYNSKVYFPLTTIADIFSPSFHTAVYIGGKIYFSGVMDEKPYYSADPFYDSLERDTSLINYSYNELCFAVDNLYGRPPKAKIAESIKKKGFNKSLDEYSELTKEAKKLLKSKNKIDYYFGLFYLDTVFDDGGHTSFSGLISQTANAKSDTVLGKALTKVLTDADDERLAKVSDHVSKLQTNEGVSKQIKAARKKAYSEYDTVKEWSKNNFLLLNGKTVIFVFDSFSDSVVEPFKWSLDYAQKKGVDNFVIDLSCNTGGSSSVAVYMLSIMTGSGDLSMKNTATGNKLTETAKVDKNLDGKFNKSDDEVKYDLNYAILTSRISFSSANLMPCKAQEKGVKILGETSGGGTCMLSKLYYPEASAYTMSGTLMMLDKEGNDIDGGAKPDAELVTAGADGLADFSGLYDIDKINAAFTSEEETQAPAETTYAADTDNTKSTSPDNGIPYYIWILIAVGAVIVIIEVLIYIYRRRKYN